MLMEVLPTVAGASTMAASAGGSAAGKAVMEDPGGCAGVFFVPTTTLPFPLDIFCGDGWLEAIGDAMRMLHGMDSTKSNRPRCKRGWR